MSCARCGETIVRWESVFRRGPRLGKAGVVCAIIGLGLFLGALSTTDTPLAAAVLAGAALVLVTTGLFLSARKMIWRCATCGSDAGSAYEEPEPED